MANEKVKLDFEDWRFDSYKFTVEGTEYEIKRGGTEVPKGRSEAIQEEARKHGVGLKES